MDNIEKNQFRLLSLYLLIITIIIVTFINYHRIYGEENSNPSLTITEGIASGDVTHDSVIIWSRINEPSIMHVEFANNVLFLNSYLDKKIKCNIGNSIKEYLGLESYISIKDIKKVEYRVCGY